MFCRFDLGQSEKTPNLCHLAPAGPTYMEDLNEAGGVYAVMNELSELGLLNLDCMTVTGKTMEENLQGVSNKDTEIIRPVENPYSQRTRQYAILLGEFAGSHSWRYNNFLSPRRASSAFEALGW